MRQSVGFALSLLIGAPAVLGAQGFGIYELGACGMARAGTGVAAPCPDGSAIFFNPAGLAGLKGWHVSAGGTLIKALGNFTSDAIICAVTRSICRLNLARLASFRDRALDVDIAAHFLADDADRLLCGSAGHLQVLFDFFLVVEVFRPREE